LFFATFFEGMLIWRAHPLSASYGTFSFILSILCAHLVYLGGAYRESLGERTANLLFIFLVCLYMWRARHSERERVVIGTQFSILYTSMYSPAEAATPRA
jgi:high-affinity Fe2+/Pb2+ permease